MEEVVAPIVLVQVLAVLVQKRQLDSIQRNEERIQEIINKQQKQIIILKEQNDNLSANQLEITKFINAVIESYFKRVKLLEDKMEKYMIEDK